MTSVLLLTNKEDVTIDFVVKELKQQGVHFYRLNTEDICKTVSFCFDFMDNRFILHDSVLKTDIDLLSFTSVYYRRPELPSYDDSGLTNGEQLFLRTEIYYLLEGLYKILGDKIWLNKVFNIRESENKLYQLMIAKELGFLTPQSLVTNQPKEFYSFAETHECIIKPIHNGRVLDEEKPQVVFTSKLTERSFADCEICYSANYLQECIKKKSDVRVTIVDEEVFAVSIDSQNNPDTIIDWRQGQHILNHTPITLPKEVDYKCKALMKKLNLRYGAIDFIQDVYDNLIFLEINPNGQWAWVEHLTGLPISKAIVKALCV